MATAELEKDRSFSFFTHVAIKEIKPRIFSEFFIILSSKSALILNILEKSLSPVEAASNNLLKDHVGIVLESLNHREQRVLQLRFGLEDGRSRTLEEVGREFGVTRERIRQIEAKALRKLRHPTRSKKLKDFIDQSY